MSVYYREILQELDADRFFPVFCHTTKERVDPAEYWFPDIHVWLRVDGYVTTDSTRNFDAAKLSGPHFFSVRTRLAEAVGRRPDMFDNASADPDVLLLRKILHAHQRAYPNDSSWGNMSYLKGSYDDIPGFRAALVVLKENSK